MRKSQKQVATQNTIDQTPRFEEGATIEIATCDQGWLKGTVRAILPIPEGILYSVHYVPLWDTTGKGGYTVATGAAIR